MAKPLGELVEIEARWLALSDADWLRESWPAREEEEGNNLCAGERHSSGIIDFIQARKPMKSLASDFSLLPPKTRINNRIQSLRFTTRFPAYSMIPKIGNRTEAVIFPAP